MGNTNQSTELVGETKRPELHRRQQEPPNWAYHVLAYLDWEQRFAVPLLCVSYTRWTHNTYYYQWICDRLCKEHGVYCPNILPPGDTFVSLAKELWPLRNLFVPSLQDQLFQDVFLHNQAADRYAAAITGESLPSNSTTSTTERFNIRVVARFRPSLEQDFSEENDVAQANQERFVLPLHQRLQLIRLRDGCDAKEALKRLKREGGWSVGVKGCRWKKQAFEGEMKVTEEDLKANIDGVDMRAHIHTVDEATGQVIVVAPSVGMRPFNFDFVLRENASQRRVYAVAASRLVMDFLNGYSAAAIMYGQTGSGKTYTMTGPPELGNDALHAPERGILPRVCKDVFSSVQKRMKLGISCRLYVSYVEIFGDQVSDLLRDGAAVGHNKVSAQRYVMEGEARKQVHSYAEIAACLAEGDSQKRRAATAMNQRSSRAHSVFILSLEMLHAETGVCLRPQFFLADLGGSEQVKKSKVYHGASQQGVGFVIGQRMREAIHINSGLLALKNCISALNMNRSYIPFQNSKLTMLLSPALGGDSKAAVIVCASKEDRNATETLQALRFGENCSRVKNDARRNQSAIQQIIDQIDLEIADLEDSIRKKERWESKEIVRTDHNIEEGTYEAALAAERGGEVVRVGMIVGAETERERLVELIRRRARLTGEDAELKLAAAGFGGQYGGKADSFGGNAEARFKDHSEDEGLVMNGQKIAQWKV